MESYSSSQEVAGYLLGGVIGVGAYGEVRYANCLESGDLVALKVVDLSRFPEETANFMFKEIKILKMIEHKYCVKVLSIKKDVPYEGTFCDSCACSSYSPKPGAMCGNCNHSRETHSALQRRNVLIIVQELAAGGELFRNLEACKEMSEDLARSYFREIMEGMVYLHSRNIAHRDLKPENLVFDHNFKIKIVDFGLAALMDPCLSFVLHSGVGGLPYSAPEVYFAKTLYPGRGYSGPAGDIWSAAVVLFVMLTGRIPFLRPLTHTIIHHNQTHKKCEFFKRLLRNSDKAYTGVPSQVRELLVKMFSLDPAKRPSAKEILSHPWLNGSIPDEQLVFAEMEERSATTWQALGKSHMIDICKKRREQDQARLARFDVASPAVLLSPSSPFRSRDPDLGPPPSPLNIAEPRSDPFSHSLLGFGTPMTVRMLFLHLPSPCQILLCHVGLPLFRAMRS
jgi:serine/threonine protein kinase